MTIETYQRGETVPIWAESKTSAGVFFPPDDGVTITLYKPDGTLADDGASDIDDVAMDVSSTTGKYVYYYDSASDDPVGWWRYFCKSVDGTGADAKIVISHGSFKLN